MLTLLAALAGRFAQHEMKLQPWFENTIAVAQLFVQASPYPKVSAVIIVIIVSLAIASFVLRLMLKKRREGWFGLGTEARRGLTFELRANC